MKATGRWVFCAFVFVSSLFIPDIPTSAQDASARQTTATNLTPITRQVPNWQPKKRSAHQTEWQSVSYRTNAGTGKVTASTNSYIELGTGLNYFDPATQRWEESKEEIEIINGNAIARKGQHKVTFAANINSAAAIQTVASDGKELKSHVLGLAYTDAATGKSVLIATVQGSIGEVAGNQVIYRNAFDGPFKADLRYTYTKGGFEQDVIFRQAPPAPEEYGMDSFTARLEVWTEFLAPPQPVQEFSALKVEDDPAARAVMVDPDLTDETLNFGAMRIGAGTAFSLDQSTNALEQFSVPVGKNWLRIEGRDFLIEKVDFQDAAPSLEQLPAAEEANAGMDRKQASLNTKPRSELLAALRPPGRSRDQAAASPVPAGAMRMAGVFPKERGFVLDYSQLNSGQANMVFKSTETYHVTAPVSLTGTTVIEGGTVVKFNSGTYFTVSGAIACNTELYRPAYFTARDDNSVGEVVAGSTGVPSGYYAGYIFFLSDATTSYDLRHLRLRYASQGIYRSASGSGAATITLRHSQIQDCNRAFGVYYSPVTLRNVLMYRTQIGFYSTAATYGENVTFHRIKQLVTGPSQPPLQLKNALLISCTNNVSFVDNGGSTPNPTCCGDAGIFETFALGQHYLPANSGYRSGGINTIDANLLSDLKQTTTRAPILLTGTLAENKILGPDVARNSATVVDRGYAYPAMDYLAQNYVVQGTVSQKATLLITNGAVVGMDPTVGAAGAGRFGIQFGPYSELLSMGAPDKLNRLLPVQLIQENGPGAANWPSVFDTFCGASVAANAPSAHLRFTDLTLFAGTTHRHLALWYGGFAKLAIQDSQVRGGTLNGLYLGSDIPNHAIALTNTLFEGVQITYHPYASGSLHAWNNLFKGGALIFDTAPSGAPLPVFYDNLFDKVAISQVGGPSVNGDYNAYVETPPTTTRLQPVGSHDRPEMSFSPAYEIGPFGSNYLPATATQLINQGSRNSATAGLYHYTTSKTAGSKEGTEGPSPYQVNIGLHYVAANSSNQPTDQDGDGLPDYIEDRDGDNVLDIGETSYQDVDTDYDGRSDRQELAEDGTNPQDAASVKQVRLGYWRFNNTSWLGEAGQQPMAVLGSLSNPSSWSGKALGLNSASPANLKYRDVEAGGSANINCRQGTIRFWFKPDWLLNVGPGGVGRLIEMGNFSNPAEGWWALSVTPPNPMFAGLKFETRSPGGVVVEHFSAPIQWINNGWHRFTLTYSPSGVAMDVRVLDNGLEPQQFSFTGPGIAGYPTAAERALYGFSIGSNRTGTEQAKGQFEELETFNYALSSEEITSSYAKISKGAEFMRVGVVASHIRVSNVNFNFLHGPSAEFAMLLDNDNFASATWLPYLPSATVNIGSVEGPHDVWFGFRDIVGKVNWLKSRVYLDVTHPTITVTTPAGSTERPSIQVLGYADEPLASVTFDVANADGTVVDRKGYVLGNVYNPIGGQFIRADLQCFDVGLAAGNNTVTISTTDLAGNMGSAVRSFNFSTANDITPPSITVTWPPNNMPVSGDTFTLTGTLDDGTASVKITGLNSEAISGVVERNGRFTFSGLPLDAGAHNFTIIATDAAGNSSQAARTVQKSSLSLQMNPVSPVVASGKRATITGTVGAGVTTVTVNGVEAPVNNGEWTAPEVPATYNGQRGILIVAVDPGTQQPVQTYVSLQKVPVVRIARYFDDFYLYLHTAPGGDGFEEVLVERDASWAKMDGGSSFDYYHDKASSRSDTIHTTYFLWLPGEVGPPESIAELVYTGENFFGPPWNAALETRLPLWFSDASLDQVIQDAPLRTHHYASTELEVQVGDAETSDVDVALLVAATAKEFDHISSAASHFEGTTPLPAENILLNGQPMQPHPEDPNKGVGIITVPSGKATKLDIRALPQELNQYSFKVESLEELPMRIAVDANRDGNVTLDEVDRTTPAKPFVFWANNDVDRLHLVDCLTGCVSEEDDLTVTDPDVPATERFPDYLFGAPANRIPCKRDLEDYARIHFPGLHQTWSQLPEGYSIELVFRGANAPGLNLFRAVEGNGGENYLSVPATADQQIGPAGYFVGKVSSTGRIILSQKYDETENSTFPLGEHFIFCGTSAGSGELVLQIKHPSGAVVGENSIYITIQDIKSMYERFSVGDITWPGTSPLFTPSPGFVVENQLPVPTAIAEQDYILFVHGWGMEPWEKERFAETAFKRLYWLKYRGRFGLFKWPTYYLTGGLLHELAFEQVNFDRSEFNGWLSGTGLNSLCGYLNQRFPGRVRMFSHSLGAVPSGEALRLFGVNKPLHTYVASQAAISVHCYNPNPAFNMPFIGVLNDHTPNVYAEFWATGSPQYFLNIQGANFFMNYYNAKDWALGANIWQVNQMTKPDNSIGYSYTQTTPPQNGFSKNATALSFPVDTYEIFSFGAESRSHALGTIANAGGAFLAQGQIDLDATFLFGEQHVGHSAQFRSNIQARRAYWNSLRSSFGIPQ